MEKTEITMCHFSEKPLNFKRDFYYPVVRDTKPDGLWLSDEASSVSWTKWCRSEGFHLGRLKFKTPFKINTEKCVYLKSYADIIKFSKVYGYKPHGFLTFIKWDEVKKKYSGIIITPYIWEARLDDKCFWYYGWDVASACIWDTSVITTDDLSDFT